MRELFAVFFLLFLVSIVALVVGLIRPSAVIRWGRKRSRKMVGLVYGLAAFVLIIASGVAAPQTTVPPPNSVSAISSNTSSVKNTVTPNNSPTSNATLTNNANNDNSSVDTNTTQIGNSIPLGAPPSNDVGNTSGVSSNVVSTQPANATSTTPSTCRSNWSAGVYHTYRFDLLSSCRTASGTVETVRHEADHDYHLDIKLDSKYTNMLATGNYTYQHGYLVVEIIPMDQPYVPIPYVGEHITVTGAFVDDKDHGWNEIHPAWIVNGKGHIGYTAAAAQQSVITGICGNGDKDCPSTSSSSTSSSSSSSSGSSGSTASTSGLTVISSTLNVSPGSMASVEVKTKPGVQGQITVEYSSGASTSTSLNAKTSDSQGYITWTWKVGTRTEAGDWPVIITADGKTIQLTLHVQ